MLHQVTRLGVIGHRSYDNAEKNAIEVKILGSFFHYQRGCPSRFSKLINDFIRRNGYSSLFIDDIFEVVGYNLWKPADVVLIMDIPRPDSVTYLDELHSFLDSISMPYIDMNDEETVKLLKPIEDMRLYIQQTLGQYYDKVAVVGSLKLVVQPAVIKES